MPYPKRLIEVDLPIQEISAHARREKSIRHGHISTLHIWWARRPLAACRAVLCAALWPDPLDEHCPQSFRDAAAAALCAFAEQVRKDAKLAGLCSTHWTRWNRTNPHTMKGADPGCWPDMRCALFDFIADFANWDAATVPAFLETARTLTQAAHEALGGLPGTRPLVVDPFAGGGAIPLEALRIGADAFASDLNPVAVLLNKVVLEYIPRYGQRLADEVRRWGHWIQSQAEKELGAFYPHDEDGATPIAYLWARTIRCEGPGCGAEVPLLRSPWLAKRERSAVALRLVPDPARKQVEFEIVTNVKASDVGSGTVRKGSATCPVCGYTTPVAAVRRQFKERRGGARDARLLAVVTTRPGQQGRFYRLPAERDLEAVRRAAEELERRKQAYHGTLSLVPDEEISLNEIRRISVPIYGMTTWGDLFATRQALALTTLARLVREGGRQMASKLDSGLVNAVQVCLALSVDKQADLGSALTRWKQDAECPVGLFGRQAVPMVWDFAEAVPTSQSSGSWSSMYERTAYSIEQCKYDQSWYGTSEKMSATTHPLPDDSANALITDPPYYDAVPYAHLSDFFYVWLRRMLGEAYPGLFGTQAVPKDEEIVVDRPHELSNSTHDIAFYERELTRAFAEARRVLRPDGIGTIVFASKTTASWEAILKAIVDAGWRITGSWPIDTEMAARVAAQGQSRLASSVHIVCRPRETPTGEVDAAAIGDWRDVLEELPRRIHTWLPRLTEAGVVGADAIFACLGPALEVFSRYTRIERTSGQAVTLREYLEEVWAAVSREALAMIFSGADATGFEEDARLTAMWLWTLAAGGPNGAAAAEEEDEGEEGNGKAGRPGGYVLEYDAARKIAQGLGAHLEALSTVVQVKGETARLLPVRERAAGLFGQAVPAEGSPGRRSRQLGLFEMEEMAQGKGAIGELNVPPAGATVLDRVHQAMLLFAAGRGEALKRFLVDDGVGQEARFWRLAQALSALYPGPSDEKRWVDGVLARKKGLGL